MPLGAMKVWLHVINDASASEREGQCLRSRHIALDPITNQAVRGLRAAMVILCHSFASLLSGRLRPLTRSQFPATAIDRAMSCAVLHQTITQDRQRAARLNELAEVAQSRLLGVWDILDQDEDGVDNGLFVLKATVLPQHIGQEVHQCSVPTDSTER